MLKRGTTLHSFRYTLILSTFKYCLSLQPQTQLIKIQSKHQFALNSIEIWIKHDLFEITDNTDQVYNVYLDQDNPSPFSQPTDLIDAVSVTF